MVALLLGLAWLASSRSAPVALAHANLVRAEPAPNAILQEAPQQVTIWFTEPLEPQFSQIQVLDGSGQAVDLGDSRVDDRDPAQLAVGLGPLVDGTYTVAWTNVSTVDGHKVRGSYVFSIGEAISSAVLPALGDQPLLQSPLEPVLRWLTLISMMAIVGGFAFQFWVMRPALEAAGSGKALEALRQALAKRSALLNGIALSLFLLASIGHLLLQAAITTELPLFQAIGQPLAALLFETSWGRLWLVRMALALLLGALLWLGEQGEKSGRLAWGSVYEMAAAVVSLAILLTLSLSSHAAATVEIRGPALFNDYLHLLAAAVWVGALFHFAPAVPLIRGTLAPAQRRTLLAILVPRFSVLGIASVAVLAVSGLYSTWAQVTLPAALATPYGRVLLLKVVLVGVILALAAINLLRVRPRLAREDAAGDQLRKLVAGEAGIAVLILLLVGLLTALEPARQVASRLGLGQDSDLVLEDSNEGVTINLNIKPAQAGPNQMVVMLTDDRGRPIDNADDVSIRPTYLQTDLGEAAISATNLGGGQYEADGVLLGLAGPWQVGLIVRRPDAFDARTAFRFELNPAQAGNSTAIAPDARTGQLLWAAELALLGVVLVGAGLVSGRRRGAKGAAAAVPGIMALGAAVFLAFTVQPDQPPAAQALQPAAGKGNPFLPDDASLSAGRQVYEAHCMICHGLTGHGDGPRSAGTDAVDIIEHVPLHADLEYFDIVPAHNARGDLNYSTSEISEEDIWHLINYLHAFEADQLLAEEYFAQARDLAAQGELEGASALLDQVVELAPRFVQALQGRSIMAMDQGNLEQAIADLDRIVALDPTYADGFYYRAEAYRLSGRLADAVAGYSQAIALEPTHSDALYARGVLHANNGAQEKAIDDLQRFLQLEPQSGDRAAVEALIAQLGGVGTAPGGDQAAAPTLALADLPNGFEPLPPANLGLVAGGPIAIGTTIASSFAFGHSAHFELLAGYTTPLAGPAEQDAFDSSLNSDELLAFLSDGLGVEEVLESAPLPAPEGLGDAMTGVTAVFSTQGRQSGVDGLAFRRGEVGALLFVVYGNGELPSIALDELATTLAYSITP
jgi:copper transport protein